MDGARVYGYFPENARVGWDMFARTGKICRIMKNNTENRRVARPTRSIRPTRRKAGSASAEPVRGRHASADAAGNDAAAGNGIARSSARDAARSGAAPRKASGRKNVFLIAAVIAVVVVLIGCGVGFAYYQTIQGNLSKGVDDDLMTALDTSKYENGEPFYMLLLGVDKSEKRSSSAQYAGDSFRSDSMILTRVDPTNKKVTMVSLHRDTLIDMGEYGQQKLNAAHAFGGPAYTIKVVSQMAGVPISHYAEIDFDGFRAAVDALGGVEVTLKTEVNDPKLNKSLPAGTQTLNGKDALFLCRSRHSYDDIGDGDRFRAANQRMVLSAVAKKLLSSDPLTMANTISSLSEYITTTFNISDVVSLASAFRGMDTKKDLYTSMEPTIPLELEDGYYEQLDTAAWQTMMDRVEQGLPPTEKTETDALGTVMSNAGEGSDAEKSSKMKDSDQKKSTKATVEKTVQRSGTVDVKNGSGIEGCASDAAKKIKKLGYTCQTGNANADDYEETLVVYDDPNKAEAAQEIARALGVGMTVYNEGGYVFDGDFLVVIGGDWIQ